MKQIPELTDDDMRKLNRAVDRIEAGISVYRTHGHPVKHKRTKWDMDGMLGSPITNHPIYPHPHVFTDP